MTITNYLRLCITHNKKNQELETTNEELIKGIDVTEDKLKIATQLTDDDRKTIILKIKAN